MYSESLVLCEQPHVRMKTLCISGLISLVSAAVQPGQSHIFITQQLVKGCDYILYLYLAEHRLQMV